MVFHMYKTATAAVFLAVLTISAQAQDQDRDRDHDNFSCQSVDGQRTFCRADMSRGQLQMTRQLGDVRCIEGQTWGREGEGVWVDRGCRAEFAWAPRPRMTRIEAGAVLPVRTNERISAERVDGRVFTGSVDHDVVGENGQVAIPRGSPVELIVRVAHDQDLILDVESVTVDGQRYAVAAGADRIDAKDGPGTGAARTGKFVGGGAVLGAILGAAAGGGKGAAIGAAVGAGAGATAEIATSGREVRVPSESLVTFRIEQPLILGVSDSGYDRDGDHYHRPDGGPR